MGTTILACPKCKRARWQIATGRETYPNTCPIPWTSQYTNRRPTSRRLSLVLAVTCSLSTHDDFRQYTACEAQPPGCWWRIQPIGALRIFLAEQIVRWYPRRSNAIPLRPVHVDSSLASAECNRMSPVSIESTPTAAEISRILNAWIKPVRQTQRVSALKTRAPMPPIERRQLVRSQ